VAATPINTLPLGLLGFLGIKNGGQYADTLGPTLLPTLEQAGWYFANRAEVLTATTTANAVGSWFFGTTFDVPQSQIWIVLDSAVYTNALLGSEAAELVQVIDFPTTGNVPCFIGDAGPRKISTGHRATASKNREYIWMPPGSRFGFFATELTTAGTITVQGNLRFVRAQL
jgi:hypothetical protein